MYLFRFNYMRSFLICIFSFLFTFPLTTSIAQTNKIDSLKRELNKGSDSAKVNLLNTIALQYEALDLDTAEWYLNIALSLAEKIDYTKGIINSYNYLGTINIYKGNYDKALKIYLEIEQLCEKSGYKSLIAYNNIAVCFYYLNNYQKSLDYYLKELEVEEAAGKKEWMVGTNIGIGNIYWKTKQYKNALSYYRKALDLSTVLKSDPDISLVLKSIGNIYYNLNNNDTALVYYNKALQIDEKLGNKPEFANTLMNIGNVYNQKKYHEKALDYYKKALNRYKELENTYGIAQVLINIGILEYQQNNSTEKAIIYLRNGLDLASSIGDKELVILGNEGLSEAYLKKGDFKNAYDHYKTYTLIKDSVFTESSTKAIAEMQTKYDTEKKEKEIESLTKDKRIRESELKNQRNVRNGLILGVVLLLTMALLAYNRYRIKQKASKEIAQKNKEITESISYAKRIQSSFLTSEKYISQRLTDYFIYYNPRNIVSGDFYWLMDKGNNLYVCTADCTGHGIPGAFMSLISMGILNEIIYSKTHLRHTDEILNELRRIIILAVNPEGSSEEGKDGMDAVLCRFDFNKMELEYSAANNSFFIIRNNELLVFKPDKMPVGKHLGAEKPFTRNTISIEKGDCIYTFSDGYADQFGGPQNKKFQSKRMKELFLSNCHKPMSVQKEIYEKTLKDWQGAYEQVDDILVMGIRV